MKKDSYFTSKLRNVCYLAVPLVIGVSGCVGLCPRGEGFRREDFREVIGYSEFSKAERREADRFWEQIRQEDGELRKVYTSVYERDSSFNPLNPSLKDKDLISEEARIQAISDSVFSGH